MGDRKTLQRQPTADAPEFFEGTEKRIEIDFAGAGDLRTVPQEDWDEVVRRSATLILNQKDTPEFRSYLLSESSLIVYPGKVILKTCGKTVPTRSIPKILAVASGVGMSVEWLSYSRKDFLAPTEQPPEHQSFEAETALCREVCKGVGDAYILGPITGEHWLVYDAEFIPTDCARRGDYQIDIMMYDLPSDVSAVFETAEPEGSRVGASAMTRDSGLDRVVASMGGEIDDYCFAPCGYSCNIHAGEAYAMVHVTPQESCSYASFETNFGSVRGSKPCSDSGASLNKLVGEVLDCFRPKRFTITVFLDEGAKAGIGSAPWEACAKNYKRKMLTSTYFEQDYSATIASYILLDKKRPREDPEPEAAVQA